MKSVFVTAFAVATAGLTIAAPQAAAETGIRTFAIQNGPCHVNQTYELGIAHNSQGFADNGQLTFTDNGVQVRISATDHGDGWVDWTPTTTGRHILKLSGDYTPLGSDLTLFGSSALASGSSMFRAADVTVETMVVSASDTTTACLK